MKEEYIYLARANNLDPLVFEKARQVVERMFPHLKTKSYVHGTRYDPSIVKKAMFTLVVLDSNSYDSANYIGKGVSGEISNSKEAYFIYQRKSDDEWHIYSVGERHTHDYNSWTKYERISLAHGNVTPQMREKYKPKPVITAKEVFTHLENGGVKTETLDKRLFLLD